MKKKEFLVIIVLVIAMICGYMGYQLMHRAPVTQVVVYHHKKKIATIDLTKNHIYTFKGDIGTFHLQVKDHRYRAIDVDCPNQICVHTGWVKLGDEQFIVCAPNGLTVTQETSK